MRSRPPRRRGARRAWALSLLALPAPACTAADTCGPSSARVVNVVDGDTVDLEDGTRVRYLLVDTPEVSGTPECFGDEARTFNRQLVEGRTVELTYDVECTDRYDRTLAYLTVDGRDVNALLLERGYACVLQIPPNGADRVDEYRAVQGQAQADGVGLWGACDPVPCL